MNIEGTYTVQARSHEVWRYLTDPELLNQTAPGITSVSSVDEHTHTITIFIDNAPFKGSHQGQITLSELQYPYHYRLSLSSEGALNLQGVGSIHLHERDGKTIIAYKGALTAKTTALWSPALVKGAAKLFIQQYFHALADHLRMLPGAQSVPDTQTTSSTVSQPAGEITIVPHAHADNNEEELLPDTVSAKVVHLLHLGAANTEEQVRWERRLRRTSTITGLLVLVWIGTKLPRRRG
ncbi:CoxG family protein [Dictyobacter arantiisoli]|uniref:Carbon monoxide dehydrogenase subunit G n=1 Tax=Dictyobacter arantiisoli TaxID=2014874 RepID=A0A5A5TDU2_9CHLR|nr:SRPBCC domain-containing protein [Dictyobacter arantiisoli]GCF09054.1 hypothetical protein KDI_26180 [Dictyobacter arantiisoli]